MRSSLFDAGDGELDQSDIWVDDSTERAFRRTASVDDQWGRSESLDPDDVGDIADEGHGHRG